tara:strand:+ start:238 stop:630 length:393 start_codon:yes stop_codon:yes gene_type:complete
LLKILGTELASTVLKKHSPEQRLFQAIVLQAFEDALTTHGTKEDSYLKKDAHDWFLEKNKTFEYVCWNSGFDPEIIHEKYKRLLKDGKVTFTELQKEWVKYRNLYIDYRAANNSEDRKCIMEKIMKVKLK